MYIQDVKDEGGKEFDVLQCPTCGNTVSTHAERCWKCGNAIDKSSAKKVVEAPPAPKKGWNE